MFTFVLVLKPGKHLSSHSEVDYKVLAKPWAKMQTAKKVRRAWVKGHILGPGQS